MLNEPPIFADISSDIYIKVLLFNALNALAFFCPPAVRTVDVSFYSMFFFVLLPFVVVFGVVLHSDVVRCRYSPPLFSLLESSEIIRNLNILRRN